MPGSYADIYYDFAFIIQSQPITIDIQHRHIIVFELQICAYFACLVSNLDIVWASAHSSHCHRHDPCAVKASRGVGVGTAAVTVCLNVRLANYY